MLKRVKIQGYKSLVDVEVNLQPLTVLFGPNASGKSNFLDLLQLISSIATCRTLKDAFSPPYRGTPLESFTFGPLGIKDLLTQDRVSFSVEVDIELSQTIVDKVNREIRAARGTKTVAEGNKTDSGSNVLYIREKYLSYRIEIEMLPKSGALRIARESLTVLDARHQFIQDSVSENPGDSSILSTPAYHYHSGLPYLIAMREEVASWYFFYLEPRERMRFPTPVKEVRHIGLMGEELAAFLNTLRALDERQFQAVEKALHMIIPSFTGIDVSVNNFGEVELSLMQGQTPIPARILSEGTLRILGLLALGGAKEFPSLLGFEEPENGIHPDRLDLVVLLLKTLTSNDIQVIATTHSLTLLDLTPNESLYVCRQINGSTDISPLSTWLAIEETRSVSERLLRGDFNA